MENISYRKYHKSGKTQPYFTCQKPHNKSSLILEINLSLTALVLLNTLARNIKCHAAIHGHRNMHFKDIQNIRLSTNSRVAYHRQKARDIIRLQIRAGQQPVGDDIHCEIHAQSFLGLGVAGWPSGFTYKHVMVIKARGGVTVSV